MEDVVHRPAQDGDEGAQLCRVDGPEVSRAPSEGGGCAPGIEAIYEDADVVYHGLELNLNPVVSRCNDESTGEDDGLKFADIDWRIENIRRNKALNGDSVRSKKTFLEKQGFKRRLCSVQEAKRSRRICVAFPRIKYATKLDTFLLHYLCTLVMLSKFNNTGSLETALAVCEAQLEDVGCFNQVAQWPIPSAERCCTKPVQKLYGDTKLTGPEYLHSGLTSKSKIMFLYIR
ncbi:hypothetical protein R1sor_014006 [Riccia sorocarpa]|uniref:Uncharacterized protein n=1 Tax=Riccia sorocarpa TaxID=122646 RepID=A0ABD3HAS4_9MARC